MFFLSFKHYFRRVLSWMHVKLRLGRLQSPLINLRTFSKSRMAGGRPMLRAA
jgi:hypothetical protein